VKAEVVLGWTTVEPGILRVAAADNIAAYGLDLAMTSPLLR
jgi:hypothetical protein